MVTRKTEEKAMSIQEQDTVDYMEIPDGDGLEPENSCLQKTRDASLCFGGQRFNIYADSGFVKYMRFMYM